MSTSKTTAKPIPATYSVRGKKYTHESNHLDKPVANRKINSLNRKGREAIVVYYKSHGKYAVFSRALQGSAKEKLIEKAKKAYKRAKTAKYCNIAAGVLATEMHRQYGDQLSKYIGNKASITPAKNKRKGGVYHAKGGSKKHAGYIRVPKSHVEEAGRFMGEVCTGSGGKNMGSYITNASKITKAKLEEAMKIAKQNMTPAEFKRWQLMLTGHYPSVSARKAGATRSRKKGSRRGNK